MGGQASLPQDQATNFQYPNQPQAAQGALGGIGSLNTNPNASYNSGASTAGGSALTTTGASTLPYVNQALTTAFDPQQALFAKQFQQQQDQQNVTNAQNGVAGTPYGAGLSQQGNQNFDIAWQQAQLQNQATGANTANTLQGGATNSIAGGTSVGQSVPSFSNQQQQQAIADFLAYLQGGTGASSAANNAYATGVSGAVGNQQLANQSTAGLGQLGGTLLGLFGL
jgi:hypothetical protein